MGFIEKRYFESLALTLMPHEIECLDRYIYGIYHVDNENIHTFMGYIVYANSLDIQVSSQQEIPEDEVNYIDDESYMKNKPEQK
ncbi:14328_t:CDS:1, partial [Acaulospora colombiana]